MESGWFHKAWIGPENKGMRTHEAFMRPTKEGRTREISGVIQNEGGDGGIEVAW